MIESVAENRQAKRAILASIGRHVRDDAIIGTNSSTLPSSLFLEVVEAILEEGHRQTGDQRWAPSVSLRERVARGELGRKSGRGFTPSD